LEGKEATELEKDDDALKKAIRKIKELGEDIEFAVK